MQLTDDMQRVVTEQRLGFWATVGADGRPNLSPKATTDVWDDGHLWCADICSPRTVANIRAGSWAEINVVDPFVRKGFRFSGPVAVHGPGTPEFDDGTARLRAGGSTLVHRVCSILVLAVEAAAPLISPAYDAGTFTEAQARALHGARFARLGAAAAEREAAALTDDDRVHLGRCVELATEALDAGDEPFGSVLVDGAGSVRAEDRNRVVTDGDPTLHPEFELARWAARNLTVAERAAATVYTSGEHCPMCSAAHAWVGLGRVVYATSGAQLGGWLTGWGFAAGPVANLPITAIAPGVVVGGPDPTLADEVRALHARLHGKDG